MLADGEDQVHDLMPIEQTLLPQLIDALKAKVAESIIVVCGGVGGSQIVRAALSSSDFKQSRSSIT
jgi:hypothetical protein